MPPMNEENDLLGAINAAIPSAPADEELPETEAPPEGEETEETPPEGEETEETPEGEEPEGEEEAEGEEGEEEPELDENGQPVQKKVAKDFDPMKDPLPKGTLQRTVESFERLRNVVKEERTKVDTLTTQLETTTKNHNELVGAITGAGLNGEAFSTMLSYASWYNSPNFEDKRKAYNFLVGELKALAADIGEAVPGTDPLKGHDDLAQEVQAQKLTPERAREIAMERNRRTAAETHNQRYGAQLQDSQRMQQARQQATQDLTSLGKELAGKDGVAEYQRKAQLVLKEMKDDIMALPPARWASAFKKAYALVPNAPAKPKAKPAMQPLRGNRVPAGASGKQPKSLQDAVFGAFEK